MVTVLVPSLVIMALLVSVCGRGARLPGLSWFDVPHDTNRAARRARR